MDYIDQGTGDVVILIPGAMSDLRTYEAHRESISRHYRVISPTLRYFGAGPWPDDGTNFSMTNHVNDLAAFIRQLNTGPVNFVGWSYGGALSVLLSVKHPELIKSLFVYEQPLASWLSGADLSAVSAARKAAFGPAVAASKSGDHAAAIRIVVDGAGGRDGTFDALPPHIKTMVLENARAAPLFFAGPPPPSITCAELGRFRMPVTIAAGQATPVFYMTPAMEAARCIPNSTLLIVPSEHHFWPVHSPSAFTNAVFAHLRTL